MPSEEIEKFRILESRKNYESADQWLRNFREATWDEVRTFIRFYCPPGEWTHALFNDLRTWESEGQKPWQIKRPNHSIDLEDHLSEGMQAFRAELDFLSLVGSTIRPTGYTESLSWKIPGRNYYLAPFNENGVSGGFLTFTGAPRTGKTGIACLYGEMWLAEYIGTEVLTNIPLERDVSGVVPVTTMPRLLHGIARALKAERRWLWLYDEPSLSGWMKADGSTGRSKNLERFARIIPKLSGSLGYIEQREEGVPTTIQDFAQSHIYCTAPGAIFADLPGKRGPIIHVPKPRTMTYRTGEAGYFEIETGFPWDNLFRALRYDPYLNTIEQEEASTQGSRIEKFLAGLEEKAKVNGRSPVTCRFCGESWIPKSDEPPARCPRCDKRNPVGATGEPPPPEPGTPASIEQQGQPPPPPNVTEDA